MIRYFALTDDSPIGNLAFAYMTALVDMGVSVRLVTTLAMYAQVDDAGGNVNRWGRFRDHLLTPVTDDYINVVCSVSKDWGTYWTVGVQNVLVAKPLDLLEINTAEVWAAARYDRILVPDCPQTWTKSLELAVSSALVLKIDSQIFRDAYGLGKLPAVSAG